MIIGDWILIQKYFLFLLVSKLLAFVPFSVFRLFERNVDRRKFPPILSCISSYRTGYSLLQLDETSKLFPKSVH